jgi:DNA-binding transcriptional ArsR family regulator
MEGLPDEALAQVAAYFQTLSEPTRLQILNLLRQGERSVGDLAQLCGYSSANISRHLALLTQHGLVRRESRGNSAFYSIADASVYALCDLVCGNIARQLERVAQGRAAFTVPATKRALPIAGVMATVPSRGLCRAERRRTGNASSKAHSLSSWPARTR